MIRVPDGRLLQVLVIAAKCRCRCRRLDCGVKRCWATVDVIWQAMAMASWEEKEATAPGRSCNRL